MKTGPIEAARVSSRGFRTQKADPYVHHFGSRSAARKDDRLLLAVALIRSHDGISKTELLRALGIPTTQHEFAATVFNYDRNVYEGCHADDPGEHDGWLYYDVESS